MTNPDRIAETKYGYYDDEAREYVIKQPDTPTPWINYLGEGRYGGIISNTAGGFSFDRDPRNRRITRYRYNSIPVDQPGRYVYLRDQESGEYWSATWQPVTKKVVDTYECRHGAGYTRIQSSFQNIKSELLYMVPMTTDVGDEACEFWLLTLKNESQRTRKIRSFSYVEFSFYDAIIDQQNMDWGMHIVHSTFANGVIQVKTKFRPTITYFFSNLLPDGFDTDRETFIGRYRDLSNPLIVERGYCENYESPRGNSVGVLSHELSLEPGEEIQLVYTLGVVDHQEQLERIIENKRDAESVKQLFAKLKQNWAEYLSHFRVETPDREMNAMINFWNPVQCRTTLYWSRFVSAYETGLGRGMGTRDSAQDSLATVIAVPDQVRATLSQLFHLQFRDGHTWHQFFPLTGEGGPGLAAEFPNWPQWFSDDHLWLVIAVCEYLKETSDYEFLSHRIDYWDGSDSEDSVWNHMLRAIKFTRENHGPHGLPRIGFSDWDDTMNIDHGSGKAESIWVAEQFCFALHELEELSCFLGNVSEKKRFHDYREEMAAKIERVGWDGEWYARAFDDAGNPIGIRGEQFHEISMNPQTWAVIAQLSDTSRLVKAMRSMDERLNTPYGLMLMDPAYDGAQERVRGTSTYPPGAKENGGIFCHANAWAIIAAAMMGDGAKAYQYYRQILPLSRTDADTFLVEPYVYCQNICGSRHPQYGMGRNAWLTGTAAWTYVAGTQYILGIKPTHRGLVVSPVIPDHWPGYSATRKYKGVTYHINVTRTLDAAQKGIYLDGKKIVGNEIEPPGEDVSDVYVEVVA